MPEPVVRCGKCDGSVCTCPPQPHDRCGACGKREDDSSHDIVLGAADCDYVPKRPTDAPNEGQS